MTLLQYFGMLARYNRLANERLYSAIAELGDAEYRKPRTGPFASIHALLNHILLGDRIWMARFQGGGNSTPALNTIQCDSFEELRAARAEEDARIERFFANVAEEWLAGNFSYINNQGKEYMDSAVVAAGHMFNHQTHHRGQVLVMLADARAPRPVLDMHRVLNP